MAPVLIDRQLASWSGRAFLPFHTRLLLRCVLSVCSRSLVASSAMATLGTVAFVSALALKVLVVDFLFSPPSANVAGEIGTLEVPNKLLVRFYDQPLPDGVSGRDHPAFVEALNSSLTGKGAIALDSSSIRLRHALMKTISTVGIKYHRAKGRKRQSILEGTTMIRVNEGELKNVAECRRKLEEMEIEVQDLKENIEEWKKKNTTLEKDMAELRSSMERQYANYICAGATLSEVGLRQQQRKIKDFASKTEQALWYARTFGLMPSSLECSLPGTNEVVTVNFDCNGKVTGTTRRKTDTETTTGPSEITPSLSNGDRFSRLPASEKDKIMSILYLLDHFNGSDNLYHELSMRFKDLPRSYLVWAYRKQLNQSFNVERLPCNEYEGAYISVNDMLAADLCVRMHENGVEDPEGQNFKIKISGDGARFSRTTNFLMISYAILEGDQEVLSSAGHRTFAASKAPEDYNAMKSSLAVVWRDLNELISNGFIMIDDKKVNVECHLSGDYKFLLMVMGLNKASSNYACLWCNVHKDDRPNMSHPQEHYEEEPRKRNLEKMKECLKKKTTDERQGCIQAPLINIELDKIVMDELHLILRVMDRLIKNIIHTAQTWDEKESRRTGIGRRVRAVEQAIRECKVTFTIWQKKNDDGSFSKKLDWTSLMGREKKILLSALPPMFARILPQEQVDAVTKIWKVSYCHL